MRPLAPFRGGFFLCGSDLDPITGPQGAPAPFILATKDAPDVVNLMSAFSQKRTLGARHQFADHLMRAGQSA